MLARIEIASGMPLGGSTLMARRRSSSQ